MESSKFDNELNNLIKIGIPDELAYLITCNKFKKNTEEVEARINDIKEVQEEIMNATKDFIKLSDNLNNIENYNISNSNNNNDKNKD
jgi:hypothetical protein